MDCEPWEKRNSQGTVCDLASVMWCPLFCCQTCLPRFKQWRHRFYLLIEKKEEVSKRACGTKDTLWPHLENAVCHIYPMIQQFHPQVFAQEKWKVHKKNSYMYIHSGIIHSMHIQSKCSSIGKWIKKFRYIHTVECNSTKKNKRMDY